MKSGTRVYIEPLDESGTIVGINDDYTLNVKLDDGSTVVVPAGDVIEFKPIGAYAKA